MDILFVDLPFNTYELGRKFKSAWSFKQDISPYELHLGFRYMVSALRSQHCSTDILYLSKKNGIHTRTALLEEVVKQAPLILGFTSYEGSLRESLQFIRRLKKRGVPSLICMGGHLATCAYEQILTDFHDLIDVIVLGEGEHTIVELTQAIQQGRPYQSLAGIAYYDGSQVVKTERRPIEPDINQFPFPILPDSEDWSAGEVPLFIASSRGCYGHCSFCRSSYFGERWRARTPDNVVDEIEAAARRGVKMFEFVDDNFMGPGASGKRRAVEFAEELQRRNIHIQFHISCRVNDVDEPTLRLLKETGLVSLSLGVESGVQRMLDTFNKNITVQQSLNALDIIERLELSVQVYIIFFDPYMTLPEVAENVQFLKDIRPLDCVRFEGIIFRKIIPIQGTDLFEQIRADGLLRGDYLKGHSFRFKDRRVSLFSDFMESLDIRFERIYQQDELRRIDNLYEAFKEIFEISFAEKAVELLAAKPMKRIEMQAKLNDLLSQNLRAAFGAQREAQV